MRLHRFYVEQPLGEEVVIYDVSLIKQWTKVFRYTENDSVILFNGDGKDTVYTLKTIGNKQCSLLAGESTASYIPTRKITLYLSLIKKDNFELVTQKATELGVTSIIPIISERSEKKNLNEERLIKIITEASEQCFRGNLPTLASIISLQEALTGLKETAQAIVLQMDGENINKELAKYQQDADISLFIGPEGGWSEGEEKLFKENKLSKVSLGKTVLRAETAAIAAIAIISCI